MQIISLNQLIHAVIVAYQTFSQFINMFIDALRQNIASAIINITDTDNKLIWALTLIGLATILVRVAKNKPTWIISSIIK